MEELRQRLTGYYINFLIKSDVIKLRVLNFVKCFNLIFVQTVYGGTKITEVILLLIQTYLVLNLESFELTLPLGITGTGYYKCFLYYLSISNIAYMCARASYLLYQSWLFQVELNFALSSLALLLAAYADIISGKIEFTLMCLLYLPLHVFILQALGMFLLDNQIDLKAYELKVKEKAQEMKISEANKKTLSSSLFSPNPDYKIWYEGVDDKGTRFTLKRDIIFPHPFVFNINTTIECKYLDGFIATSKREITVTLQDKLVL